MKTILTVVCMLLAMCVAGAAGSPSAQKPSAKKTTLSSFELRAYAKADPGVKNASALYSAAMATNNVEIRQKFLKCSAACLIAVGKLDVYAANIRGKLQDAERFENGVKEVCASCSGAGTKKRKCLECGGSGRCHTCNGSGGLVSAGFNRANGWRPCGKCGGKGKCSKCGGQGAVDGKCLSCVGERKLFSQAIAARVFRESCKELADAIDPVILARKEKERKEAEERAKVEAARKEKERKEAEERREQARKKREQEEKVAKALGLVDVGGKWMTPGSLRMVRFVVFQIYKPGHALCKVAGGRVFCLIYSAKDNKALAEGDVFVNDLYRCGTFSYTTVQNAPSTVAQYAIDLPVALEELKKQDDDD